MGAQARIKGLSLEMRISHTATKSVLICHQQPERPTWADHLSLAFTGRQLQKDPLTGRGS